MPNRSLDEGFWFGLDPMTTEDPSIADYTVHPDVEPSTTVALPAFGNSYCNELS